jgi:hypothetical protein
MKTIKYSRYEHCRRPGVAILDMQMSKVPIISRYDERMARRFTRRSLPNYFVMTSIVCWYKTLYQVEPVV